MPPPAVCKEKCGLGLTGQESPIAAALAGRAAVIDYPVSDEGVVARGLPHLDISLAGSGGVLGQNPVHLAPAAGGDRDIADRPGEPAVVTVIDVDAEDTVASIDFPGVDQGQVAAVLGVLLQTVDPGAAGRGRTMGNSVVEDPLLSSASG